jgi:hypothetical protein
VCQDLLSIGVILLLKDFCVDGQKHYIEELVDQIPIYHIRLHVWWCLYKGMLIETSFVCVCMRTCNIHTYVCVCVCDLRGMQ